MLKGMPGLRDDLAGMATLVTGGRAGHRARELSRLWIKNNTCKSSGKPRKKCPL